MPSTYSTSLRLELMADGEKSGTWGTITNTNLGTLIEQGVAGVASVAHDDSASYTLTTNNGSSDEARNAVVLMTGALTADREVIVPDVDKVYIFKNGTSGGFALTFKTSGGSGVTIPNGRAAICYVDSGTGTVNAIDDGYFTDSIYIEGSSAGDFITAESTNAGATSGPDIKLYRNSASPADSDVLSKITFTANTDDGAGGVSVEDVEYASINVSAPETNETSGEAGKMVIALKRGGTTQNYIEIQGGTSSDADNDSITFKTGGSAVLTIDNNQDMLIDTDSKLQFRDSAIYIQSGSDGNLNIEADTAIAFDTDTLYVDSANNNVGIGLTNPTSHNAGGVTLQVDGSANASEVRLTNDTTGTAGGNGFHLATVGNKAYIVQNEADDLYFYANGAEVLRINSSQQSIFGASANRQVLVNTTDNTNATDATLILQNNTQSSTHGKLFIASGTTTPTQNLGLGFIGFGDQNKIPTAFIGVYDDGATWTTGSDMPTRMVFWTTADGAASATERMRIDNAGRVTIGGVPPAAWGSSYDVLTVGSSIGGASYAGSSNAVFITNNAYNDNTNWKYSTSSTAAAYTQYAGTHTWQYAGSGTADNNITWTTALHINSSGNVQIDSDTAIDTALNVPLQIARNSGSLIKQTADYSGSVNGLYWLMTAPGANRYTGGIYGNISVSGGEAQNAHIRFYNEQTTPTSSDSPGYITFSTTADGTASATERMRIASNGDIGIGAAPVTARKIFVSAGSAARSDIQLTYDALGNTNGDGVQFGIQTAGAYIWNFENTAVYFGANNTERMRIAANGHIGVGVSPAGWDTANTQAIQVDNASFAAINGNNPFITDNAYWDGSNWKYLSSNGATNYYSAAGTHYFRRAPSGTAGNSVSFTEVARFDADGLYLPSGLGVKFSPHSSSNILDDYEHGTWTPTFTNLSSAATVTYTQQNGSYVKVGNLVFATFDCTASSISSGSGSPIIDGLPFNATNDYTLMSGYSVIQWRDSSALTGGSTGTQLHGWVERNNDYIIPQLDNSGGSYGNAGYPSWNSSGRATGYILYAAN